MTHALAFLLGLVGVLAASSLSRAFERWAARLLFATLVTVLLAAATLPLFEFFAPGLRALPALLAGSLSGSAICYWLARRAKK